MKISPAKHSDHQTDIRIFCSHFTELTHFLYTLRGDHRLATFADACLLKGAATRAWKTAYRKNNRILRQHLLLHVHKQAMICGRYKYASALSYELFRDLFIEGTAAADCSSYFSTTQGLDDKCQPLDERLEQVRNDLQR